MEDRQREPSGEVRRSRAATSPAPRELVRALLLVVVVGLLVAFVVDNSQSVRVGFVFTHANPSLIWVLIVTALLGAAADRLWLRRRSRQHR
jgi:uncharacterized integral membrane protein